MSAAESLDEMAMASQIGNIQENPLVALEMNLEGMTLMEKEKSALKERKKGDNAYISERYKDAILFYKKSIDISPSVGAYNNKAQALLKICKYKDAINDCNTVLKLNKTNVKALLRRGQAYMNIYHYANAQKDFASVLRAEKNNLIAQSLLKDVREQIQNRRSSKKVELINEFDDEIDDEINDEYSAPILIKRPPVITRRMCIYNKITERFSESIPKISSCYQFYYLWITEKIGMNSQISSEVLKQLNPAEIPEIFGIHLDANMLYQLFEALDVLVEQEGDAAFNFLEALTCVQRIIIAAMCMLEEEKRLVALLIERICEPRGNSKLMMKAFGL